MSDKHAWEQSGAHEVGPGVFRIPLPLPGDHLKAVNVYAIVDGDGLVMIDAGWALAESELQLARSLESIEFGLRDIREFLVTHIHRDHYTQAVALRRKFGSGVSLGEAEKISLDAIHTAQMHPDVPRMASAGAEPLLKRLEQDTRFGGPPDLADWEYPDRWLTDRLELPLQTRTMTVLSTPGHTRGHVVFHDAGANALFAGDHILPHITPSIGVEMVHTASPLGDYLHSLRLVQELPDATLLPAHGPVAASTHARVDELLAHHERRLTDTAAAVSKGASCAYDVAQILTWTRRERAFDELDLFNQILAVNETVAHLDVLVTRGWLTRATVDGVNRYTTN
jgi:glyoxylase-like metal-dependent hydrolase (beta-lactamase superfamily II)